MPKYRLVTPGPVAVPERVRLAMSRTLPHHRAAQFIPVFHEVRENLKKVFETEQDVLLLTGTGTSAMEAAVANTLSAGEKAIVVRGGKFGERWAELCDAFGVEKVCIDVEWGHAVEGQAVRDAFDSHPDARALLVQASETSTGVFHPIRELAEIVREHDDRLMIVDGISGVGVHPLPMDAWGIDVLVSGSQKSWLLPPGLAFIALSERARGAVERCTNRRYYLDLRKELEAQPGDQTAWTSAVSLVLGLQESLRMILEEGLENVLRRHETLAQMTRAAMQALGLELYAPDSPAFSTTAVRVPQGLDGKALVKQLRTRYNVTVTGGQGRADGVIFRIGHMGDVDEFDMITVVAALELALADLGYPVKIGEGTRAATQMLRERGLGEEKG